MGRKSEVVFFEFSYNEIFLVLYASKLYEKNVIINLIGFCYT